MLPAPAGARASWNYLLRVACDGPEHGPVSYDMNRLQRLTGRQDYIVTLNGDGAVDPDAVHRDRMDYEHPVYTPDSVAAQRRLPELNDRRTAFAGAYHGWGFHEDGCRVRRRRRRALGVTW